MELFESAIARAQEWIAEWKPIAVVGLISGGHDSLAANLIAHEAGADLSLHINTGIGIEQTRDYVRDTCAKMKWQLREYKATEHVRTDGTPDPQIYADMVRFAGFPGPYMHRHMYARLKERQLHRFERDIGATPARPVLYLCGVRSDESVRRMGNVKGITKRDGRRVWMSIIHDFSKADCASCIAHCGLKRNEVVDLIHKSGECLCGAFAQKGELDELRLWFPDTARIIDELEKEVMERWPWRWEDPGPPEWFRQKQQGQTFMLDYDTTAWQEPLCQSCNVKAAQQAGKVP